MNQLEGIPAVNRRDLYSTVFNPAELQTRTRIMDSIRGAGWSAEEQGKVIGTLGLQEPISPNIRDVLARNASNILTVLGGGTWGEMLVEQNLKGGPIHDITAWSQLLRSTSPELLAQAGTRIYDVINALTVATGSIVKAPVNFNDPIAFNILGAAAAAATFGGLGLKGIEKVDFTKGFKLKSTLEREAMTLKGIYPINKAGHILAFGATDTSLAEPLMTNLKKHGFVVPVHRGEKNSYPKANAEKLWVQAGIDKSAKTTRNMASRELLLRANAIDASTILVNCMREIGVYQPLDISDTDNAPPGVMFPQVADAIFEQITELRKMIYGENAPPQLFMTVLSRYTIIGQKLMGKEPVSINARSLFEEVTDEPTVVVEPEELVESELTNLLANLKSEKSLFGDGIKAAVMAFGDSKTNKQTRENMKEAFTTREVVSSVVDDVKDANVVIMTSTEDVDMAALLQQYRQELDQAGKKNVPIIAILKRPDTRNLAKLGFVRTINIQELISNETDRILTKKLNKSNIPPEVEKTAKQRLKQRQKMRLETAKISS